MQTQIDAERRYRDTRPPPPESARATLRTPADVQGITTRVELLHDAIERLRALRKTASVNFWDAGQVLAEIEDFKLYCAKGYASLPQLLEREDLPWDKATCLAFLRCARLLKRDAARAMGAAKAFAMLRALDVR